MFEGVFFKGRATAKEEGSGIPIVMSANGKGYRIAKAKGEALEVILWDELTPAQKAQLERLGLVIP
jgi:hypothetical protein